MEREDNDIKIFSQNKLIVGNADNILTFGCEDQQRLREYSARISYQLIDNSGELEYLIQDILNELNDFQNLVEKKQIFPLKNNEKKRENLMKKYNSVLVYMDKMELALKLQEVQLIKDSKMFEELDRQMECTMAGLQKNISYGKDVMRQKPGNLVSEDIINWYERLSKKIEDLEMSYTVAIQTGTQIRLMLRNNTQLIDKIVKTISETIPIWRNQITILLGIEKLNRNLEVQNKVVEITQKYITKEKTILRKSHKRQREFSTEKLLWTNETLKKALDDLELVEKCDGNIRTELCSLLR
ncbi:toxic anion resistance protein [Blautia faecicola]|uniref:toxic anion resistance protein n=1 Tax=Blautia faecicola TaxID=2509240 RepID=UPI0013E90278|nr:toxic anion resistance protein [Blautia faecicola]